MTLWTDFDIAGDKIVLAALNEGVPMPNVGQGFLKCVPFIGQFLEDELYHFPGGPHEVGVAVAQLGYATWCPSTNETVAHVTSGANAGDIYGDLGNHGDGSGRMVLLRKGFLASKA